MTRTHDDRPGSPPPPDKGQQDRKDAPGPGGVPQDERRHIKTQIDPTNRPGNPGRTNDQDDTNDRKDNRQPGGSNREGQRGDR